MLSVIVISFNTKAMSLECLHSIFHNNQISFEIFFFDNDSQDGTVQAVKSEFNSHDVTVLVSVKNIGFANANNQAALHASGEYLLFLNPDTVILDKAIGNLLQFAKQYPRAGIWGGRTLFADGSLNPSSCWMKQSLWSLTSQAFGLSSLFRKSSFFNPEGMGSWNREGGTEVDIVSGCFLLITYDLWKKLNGFHPDFFMYGEEADLCLRAKKFGANPMVTSYATIIHHGGASETVRAEKLVRLINAKVRLIRRHFPWYTIKIGIALLAAWPLSRYLAHSILFYVGKTSSKEAKDSWCYVWTQRRKWLNG
jgi:N-acetylglucosaminyl-diphospho-decaprenol L-rhamnosyltransferase